MIAQAIGIAVKFQKAAEFCDRLDSWPNKKQGFKKMLKAEVELRGGTVLEACHRILKRVQDQPVLMTCFMAATVELYEPKGDESTESEVSND